MRLTVRIVPNASKSEIVGEELGALKVRIAAPAVEGKANEALIELLAEEYEVSKSSVRIVHGATSKTKVVEIGN